MRYIVTALKCEARPLIDQFGLKHDQAAAPSTVYAGDGIRLLVTGDRKLRAAAAVARVLALNGTTRGDGSTLINVGVCGARPGESVEPWQIAVINQIRDHGSGRDFYPDMLVQHDFAELGLETHERGVTADDAPSLPLVDMEAAGIVAAAAPLISPDRMLFVKIVSDFLEPEQLNADQIAAKIGERLPALETLFDAFSATLADRRPVLDDPATQALQTLADQLRLSVTQRHELNRLAEAWAVRRGLPLPPLGGVDPADENHSRQQRNACFDDIRDILSQP
jgi:hypothetical protein